MLNCTVKLRKMGDSTPTLSQIMDMLVGIKKSTDGADQHRAITDTKITDLTSDITNMSATIADLEKRLTMIESRPTTNPTQPTDELSKQEGIRKNISIFGVAKADNEDLGKIIIVAIGAAINIDINTNDYSNVYRTGTDSRLIILCFTSFRKKLEFMAASKAKRSLMSSELNIASISTNLRIYINNQLTPYFSKIYFLGRKAVADKKIAACWVAFNSICIKKTASDDKCLIKSIEDMENICSSAPVSAAISTAQSTTSTAILHTDTAPTSSVSQVSPSTNLPQTKQRAPKRKAAQAPATTNSNKMAKSATSKPKNLATTSSSDSANQQPSQVQQATMDVLPAPLNHR